MCDAAQWCYPIEASDFEKQLETDTILANIVNQLVP